MTEYTEEELMISAMGDLGHAVVSIELGQYEISIARVHDALMTLKTLSDVYEYGTKDE